MGILNTDGPPRPIALYSWKCPSCHETGSTSNESWEHACSGVTSQTIRDISGEIVQAEDMQPGQVYDHEVRYSPVDYVEHKSDPTHPTRTLCSQMWQFWQAPNDVERSIAAGPVFPPMPGDTAQRCPLCERLT